jgi:hypothetical protein
MWVCALQDDLAERASWLLAEEEVLLMEQQAATAGQTQLPPSPPAAAAAVLANSPSSILDSINATDVNKMKVGGAGMSWRRGGGGACHDCSRVGDGHSMHLSCSSTGEGSRTMHYVVVAGC